MKQGVLTIIGCGNPNRSDDGAGIAVVRRLMDRLGGDRSERARLFDAGTNGMQVMFEARGASELVLVDASSSGSEPGSVFEVPGDVLQNAPNPGHGLHGFRWDHALYAGKKIYAHDFPDRVTVYLIESQTLELGLGLSEPVERAVTRVIDRILERIDEREPALPQAPMVRIANGSLYLDAEVYAEFFGERDAVAVLPRDDQIALFPLARGGAGGSLAKVRNARGDRVIHARELLRGIDVEDSDSHELAARWDQELAALTFPRPKPRSV